MHIKEFLQKSDELIEKMSAQQMKHCLTEIARKTGDNVREEFLQILNDGLVELSSNQTKNLTNSENKLSRFMSDEKVMEKIYFFEETFRKIEEGDLLFCANEYETDYDYHWDSDWEISHSDPEGIGRIIEDAADFAYECVNDLRYKQALFLFNLILELNAQSDSEDSGEYFEIGLQEMIDEGLVALNMNKLAVNTLYAKYQSTSKNKRAEVLYEYFSYPCFKNIHVEDIVSTGREKVKDFDGFLHQWIKLLLDKTGEVATRLLKEAIINYKGNEGLIQFAREKQGLRPSLYLESINELEKSTEYEKITEIGIEALEKINPILKIRSKIALKTAQASFFTGKPELMHQCWYQAFVSDTTVPNFLRLFVNEKAAADYKEMALEKLEKLECLSKTASSFSYKKAGDYFENEENAVDEITCKTLHFFKGDFEKTKIWSNEQKNPLGWTGEFIWYAVRVMLLLLFNGKNQRRAIRKISSELSNRTGFSNPANLLFFGEKIVFEKDTETQKKEEIFWNIFTEWKKYFPHSSDLTEEYISWLHRVIDKRITAIVDGKFRGKYEDIAILISALGEVRESLGEDNAKITLIDLYHKKYPRHNAFRAKLREYS